MEIDNIVRENIELFNSLFVEHIRFNPKECCEYCDCLKRDQCKQETYIKKCEYVNEYKKTYRSNIKNQCFSYDSDKSIYYDYFHILGIYMKPEYLLTHFSKTWKIPIEAKPLYNRIDKWIIFEYEAFSIEFVRFAFKIVKNEKPEFLLGLSKHVSFMSGKYRVLIIKLKDIIIGIAPRILENYKINEKRL